MKFPALKHLVIMGTLLAASLVSNAQTPVFTPGQLAVLQEGDGGPGRCAPLNATSGITNYSPSDIRGSRQTQLFIDQFDPNGVNQTAPTLQLAIPTNGPTAMLINGNSGSEGNLSLSGDKSVLTFAGYQADILSITTGQQTAPSNLSYDRGIGVVDAFTNYSNPYRGGAWYGVATGKTNPRGVATDGAGNFWGCGNGYGSLYFNASTAPSPIQFQNIVLSSSIKVINNTLYMSVKSGDTTVGSPYPAGIYSFVDFFNNPQPYPTAASFPRLEIPADPAHNSCAGFDINPAGNVAYVADDSASSNGGIQKYVRTGLTWKLAYHLQIPGYFGLTTGVMTNAGSTSVLVGCFGLTVDWSGTNPVVYATTGDSGWNSSNPFYGNRVVRIDDTNLVTSGINIIATTNILKTIARPPVVGGLQITNLIYKSVAFTPDLRPVITNNPANWSALVGDNVSFDVGTSSPFSLAYQWLRNGTNLSGETASTLTLNSVSLSLSNTTYQCVVSNNYGAVTSSIATLTVTTTPQLPIFAALQNLTNAVGNNQSISAKFTSGTDPKGGYQWFLNGSLLSDSGEFSGTTTSTLLITQASTNDAGIYSVIVTNIAGSASNAVANFSTFYSAPVMIQPPITTTTFIGRTFNNSASAYGQLLSYKWYTSTNKSGVSLPTALTPLTDGIHISGSATATLQINGALSSDATNYVIVISNPGGSITSAPAPLTVVAQPAHTFVSYTNAGQLYAQNFNSLPIPGSSSAEGANPLHMAISMTNIAAMLTNANPGVAANVAADVTYSTDTPLDFGYPVLPTGAIGGLGLSNTMNGWYGWAANALVFAATKGDQSQGAVVDNGGIYYGDGAPLTGITNRALGMIATAKSGAVAFGAAFINKSSSTFNRMTLSYTGEIWRNNAAAQPLVFGYFIDAAGTNSTFAPGQWAGTNAINYVPSMDVSFPTSAATEIRDGTLASNQVSYAVSSLTITNWPPGAALWLVWHAQTPGSAQNLAIDNVNFSAAVVGGSATTPFQINSPQRLGNGNFQFNFTNAPGVSFSVLTTTNVALPVSQWQVIGQPTESPAGQYQFTDTQATNTQRYYLIRQP